MGDQPRVSLPAEDIFAKTTSDRIFQTWFIEHRNVRTTVNAGKFGVNLQNQTKLRDVWGGSGAGLCNCCSYSKFASICFSSFLDIARFFDRSDVRVVEYCVFFCFLCSNERLIERRIPFSSAKMSFSCFALRAHLFWWIKHTADYVPTWLRVKGDKGRVAVILETK